VEIRRRGDYGDNLKEASRTVVEAVKLPTWLSYTGLGTPDAVTLYVERYFEVP
jgi:hypothetical protein